MAVHFRYEGRLYERNSHVTGRHDGQGLGFVVRDELGRMIGVAAGYTWAGTSELKQMWIDEAYRGRGYARALLNAFVTEASSRGVRRIWVASYDFQAPEMYEKAGFKRMAEFNEWPEGHINVVLCKILSGPRKLMPDVRSGSIASFWRSASHFRSTRVRRHNRPKYPRG